MDSTRALRFAYPLGLLLIFAPLLDLAGRIWPFQWYLIQWRFQAELAVVNAVPILLIGAFIVAFVAWSNESVGLLKLGGILLIVFGVLLLPLIVMLALDAIQIRQMARSEVRSAIQNNALVAGARAVLSAVATLALGMGTWKAAASLSDTVGGKRPSRRRMEEDTESSLLVVGGSE